MSISAQVGSVRVAHASTSTGAARRRRSWPPTPAPPASRARGTTRSRPGRRRRCATGVSQSGACSARPCARSRAWSTPSGNRWRLTGRPARYGSIAGAIVAWWRMRSRLVSAGASPAAPGNSTLSRLVSFSVCSPRLPRPPPCRAHRGPPARRRWAPTQRRWCSTRWPAGARLDLVVGPPALHRPRVVLGVPARRPRARRACGAAATAPCRPGSAPRRTSTKRPASFSPCEVDVEVAGSIGGQRVVALGAGSHVPQSHTMTSPPPYSPSGITPSKSKYSSGWSSTWTAIRLTSGRGSGPSARPS